MDSGIIVYSPLLFAIILGITATIHEYLKRKRTLKELQHSHSRYIEEGTAFPVRYASKRYWPGSWKYRLPWEGVGYLVIGSSWFMFIGKLMKGDHVEVVRISTQEVAVQWVGQKIMKGSLITFFRIRLGNDIFYITSDGGISVIGSEESTREIFDEIVLQAIGKKFISGHFLYTDSTHVKASANKNKHTKNGENLEIK